VAMAAVLSAVACFMKESWHPVRAKEAQIHIPLNLRHEVIESHDFESNPMQVAPLRDHPLFR